MGQTGEIRLTRLKALYSLPDIILVPKDSVDKANEARLSFEVCWSIGLTLLGAVFRRIVWSILICSIAFMLAGGFFLWRYIVKNREVNKQKIQPLKAEKDEQD